MRYATIVACCCLLVGFLEASEQFRSDDTGRIFSDSGDSVETANERSRQLAGDRHIADPDTTTPSRYYPLQVGDIWEYEMLGAPQIVRRDITDEVMIGDTLYYKWQTVLYENGIPISGTTYTVRYDEVTSFVKERVGEIEIAFAFAPCPMNADFDVTVDCEPFEQPGFDFWDSSGTYEGELVFNGALPDTLRTSIKRFDRVAGQVDVSTYAADIGQVHVENELEIFSIYYARIGGKEYGESQIPTGADPGTPVVFSSSIDAVAFPSPFTNQLVIRVELGHADKLSMSLYDIRGRRVLTQDLGSLGAGEHVRALNLSHLPAGRYLLRVAGSEYHSVSVLVTKSTPQR